MREVEVVGVRVEMPSNQPIVLLREADGGALPADLDRRRRGDRDRLRPAGRRAAAAADPRPARDVLEATGNELSEVRITEMNDGVFYAVLVLRLRRRGQRPALGLDRAGAAHRLADRLRRGACSTSAGIVVPDEQEDEVEKFREFLDHVSPEDFDEGQA